MSLTPVTTTDVAIVEAVSKGYYSTEDGQIIAPRGNARALLVKRHRGGAYQSFTYVLGSRPSRKTVNLPVHRFIAYELFGKAALEDGVKVYHTDNNPMNNARSNIRFGTPSDVMMARTEEDRKRIAGTPHNRSRTGTSHT